MASRADLRIYQGDDYSALVTVSNGLPPEEVIAGYTATAHIREDYADCAEIAVDIATMVSSPFITLSIPAAQTAKLCGEYVWDLQIESPDAIVTTILFGSVRVMQEVTR